MGNPGVRENWCRGEWGVKAPGPWGHTLPHPLSHSLSRRVRSGTSSVGNPPSAGELLHLDEHLLPGFLGVARVYGGDGGAPKRPGQADGTPGPGVALKALVQEGHDAGGRLSLSSWMIRILYHHHHPYYGAGAPLPEYLDPGLFGHVHRGQGCLGSRHRSAKPSH